MRTSDIILRISLDEQQMCNKIHWQAEEQGETTWNEASIMMLSLYDTLQQNTAGIDLWTTGVPIDEMESHCFNTLMKLAGTLERATQDQEGATIIKDAALRYRELTNQRKNENKQQID